MPKPETGYRRPIKKYELVFEEGPLAGLWVLCRAVNLDRFNAIGDMADVQAKAGSIPSKQDRDRLSTLAHAFGLALLDWNLEDEEGTSVPVSDLAEQDIDFVMGLVTQWLSAMQADTETLRESAVQPTPPVGGSHIDHEWLAQLPMQVG